MLRLMIPENLEPYADDIRAIWESIGPEERARLCLLLSTGSNIPRYSVPDLEVPADAIGDAVAPAQEADDEYGLICECGHHQDYHTMTIYACEFCRCTTFSPAV